MPSTAERTRAERLADVYGRAGRIRRRRRLTRGGAFVGSLALVAGFVAAAGPGGDRQVDVVAGPDRSTATGDTAESPTATHPPTAATTLQADPSAPATSTTLAPPPTAAGPAVDAPATGPPTTAVCRNSYDPVCGPFRYDPEPVNRPMTVAATASPTSPSPGEEVVFTVTVSDDGPISPNDCINTQQYGDGSPFSICTAACPPQPQRFGPWDPPPPEPRTVTEQFRRDYEAPGVYTAEFTYNAGADCTFSPYRSTASGTVTITVE